MDQFDAGQASEAAAGNHQGAACDEGIEGAPESDERAERKCEQSAISGGDFGRVEHVLPGFDPPPPIFGRIEHDERPAAGAGGLVAADVAFDRIRAIGGEGLVAGLGLKFFFGCLRQCGQLIEACPTCAGQPASLRR